jgi:curved DNA-binding protein CbpA
MSDDTYYTVLGIPETATQDEIKRAYRELIRRLHPDKFPGASPYWKLAVEEKSKKIIEAYHALSDSTQRSFYDQQLALCRQQHAPSPPPPPRATTTSPPRTYTSTANPGPQPQAGQREPNWRFLPISAFWGGILITVAVLLMLLSIYFDTIISASTGDP